jgi:hypothetical protein
MMLARRGTREATSLDGPINLRRQEQDLDAGMPVQGIQIRRHIHLQQGQTFPFFSQDVRRPDALSFACESCSLIRTSSRRGKGDSCC